MTGMAHRQEPGKSTAPIAADPARLWADHQPKLAWSIPRSFGPYSYRRKRWQIGISENRLFVAANNRCRRLAFRLRTLAWLHVL